MRCASARFFWFGKENPRSEIAKIFQGVLGESPIEAERLAKTWVLARQASIANWEQFAGIDLEQALLQGARIRIDQLDLLLSYLSANRQGIVLTTIHMGDFLQCLFYLVSHFKTRHISIVRRAEQGDVESKIFSKLGRVGLSHDVIRFSDKTASFKVLRNLKRGGVVVMLYDLPKRFGKTLKLKFFQHDVHWVQGPVFYAARTKALLVPFIAFRNSRGESCCDLQPILSFTGNENTLHTIPEAAQTLVGIAQRYIREYPTQWLQWPSIPAMLNAGDE